MPRMRRSPNLEKTCCLGSQAVGLNLSNWSPRAKTFAVIVFIILAQFHSQTFLVGPGNELVIGSDDCFLDMIKADILEDDKLILCASNKQMKLINYAVTPPTSKLVLDLTGINHSYTSVQQGTIQIPAEITDFINYDTTGLIYVGFNSYRVISYELPSPYSDIFNMPAGNIVSSTKVFNLPNILNGG